MTTAAERWAEIPGWEGFYEISSFGRVRSIRRLVQINSVTPDRKRWMGGAIRTAHVDKGGYLRVSLTGGGRREYIQVHRAVLMAFSRLPELGEVARHLNGSPGDNRSENLAWGTHLENMQDRVAHGHYAAGEKHVMAKLTEQQAESIRSSPLSGVELSRLLGVGTSTISRVRRGHCWSKAA